MRARRSVIEQASLARIESSLRTSTRRIRGTPKLASRIMARTTIDLDPTVLAELKRRGRREGKGLGRLVSELLAAGLGQDPPPPPEPFAWVARSMSATIDLDDPEVVRRALG